MGILEVVIVCGVKTLNAETRVRLDDLDSVILLRRVGIIGHPLRGIEGVVIKVVSKSIKL